MNHTECSIPKIQLGKCPTFLQERICHNYVFLIIGTIMMESGILMSQLNLLPSTVYPGQYNCQPYLKPWWNTAYSEMSVKNQIKQAPDKNLPFLHIFQNSRSKQKVFTDQSPNLMLSNLLVLICLEPNVQKPVI